MSMQFVRLHRLQAADVGEPCEVLRIGRLAHCEVLLDDPSVSRQHATISYERGHWLLADNGSRNGTFLNGVRLIGPTEQVVLGEGNLVQFGAVVLGVEAIDVVTETEAAKYSGHAFPWQTLVLLRQHAVSQTLPAIEEATDRFVAITTPRENHDTYLWSPSNTSPRALCGLPPPRTPSNKLSEVQRLVIHEAIRDPSRPFGGLGTHVLTWNENTVVKVAKTIWESSDFALMSILADALEEAGCDEQDILDHCRRHRQHLRCCWALRAVLAGVSDRNRTP